MAELLHHQDKVVSILCDELKACDPLHMGSFFDMIAVLTRFVVVVFDDCVISPFQQSIL